jgi:hypothetical protein
VKTLQWKVRTRGRSVHREPAVMPRPSSITDHIPMETILSSEEVRG